MSEMDKAREVVSQVGTILDDTSMSNFAGLLVMSVMLKATMQTCHLTNMMPVHVEMIEELSQMAIHVIKASEQREHN